MEMKEVYIPTLIEIYGEKRVTNILEEEIQLLHNELLREKYEIKSTTQNKGSSSWLGIKMIQIKLQKNQ
jgi:hypothetical protein